MKPPTMRPSALPALAVCPCYAGDESVGQEQKSDGTKRHTALAKYLTGEADWAQHLGDWDAGGVEWAGEYIRTHAPSGHPLVIETQLEVILDDFTPLRGTPDVAAGPVLFDLKGRDVDPYVEQMAGYVVLRQWRESTIHVLYSTERRANVFRLSLDEASDIVHRIAAEVANPQRQPRTSEWCSWCANRSCCPAFGQAGAQVARSAGADIPLGAIDQITDADGLARLRQAADVVDEWAKAAKEHVNRMAFECGVVATGYRIAERKANPTIPDAWAALQASGLTPEEAAAAFSLKLSSLTEAFAKARGMRETAAKRELESRLGDLIQRGANIRYLRAS